MAAVTATATPRVIQEISSILALKQPKILIGSFNRPNIQYSVRHKGLIGDGSDAAVLQVQTQQATSQCTHVCMPVTIECYLRGLIHFGLYLVSMTGACCQEVKAHV